MTLTLVEGMYGITADDTFEMEGTNSAFLMYFPKLGFYLKADYGIVRVLQMLWRLNFLVLFLCLTQGTTFILYYICLLHTYYFFMVYVIMRIGSKHNYTKWWIRIKLGILAVVIFWGWAFFSEPVAGRVWWGWFTVMLEVMFMLPDPV